MTKCTRIGCMNEAHWAPVLVIFPKTAIGERLKAARAGMDLPHCHAHKAEAMPDQLINDEGWTLIRNSFLLLGKVEPDRASVSIDWISLTDFDRDYRLRAQPTRGGDAGR